MLITAANDKTEWQFYFDMGRDDYRNGRGVSECPYLNFDPRSEAWIAGNRAQSELVGRALDAELANLRSRASKAKEDGEDARRQA